VSESPEELPLSLSSLEELLLPVSGEVPEVLPLDDDDVVDDDDDDDELRETDLCLEPLRLPSIGRSSSLHRVRSGAAVVASRTASVG